MAQRKPYDAIIIGGGHNGLTCACYLAAAGLKVRVLERRPLVGGAAVTEEFFPGFRNSSAAYAVSVLHPMVVSDLRLAEHGLQIVERPFARFLPLPDGNHFRLGATVESTRGELARFSGRDAERLSAFCEKVERAGAVLRESLTRTPPNIGGGVRHLWAALRTANSVRRLDMPGRRDLLELLARSAGDVLDAEFESNPIKAAFGFEAIAGHYASPYAPGTARALLRQVAGEGHGRRGPWAHAVGGMGAITQAMAAEAARRGVEITTDCEVAKVCVDARGAQGVQLTDGRVMEAACVVANVNPKLLFLTLMDENTLDADFLQRIRTYKCASATFRINVALAELPDFTCVRGTHLQSHHQSGILIAPSLAYMEQAYFDARTLGCSRAPVVEMLIPSTVDRTLAPPGRHVASLFCQHFAPELPGGLSWDGVREDAADFVIEAVTRHAPNFKGAVLGRKILSPLDLEREFGLTGGDIFHGALTFDQLWSARPVLGHADYRAPVKALYLCGAGTHPGGGVSGLPGRNAAREIVRDFRMRRLK